MLTLKCAGIVFDLDGVLVDSSTIVERHWRRWAALHSIDLDAILSISTGKRNLEVMREVAPHLDVEREAAAMDAEEALDLDGLKRYPGSLELISSLPPNRWAIATSGARDTAAARLTAVGLPIPDVLVTADDVENGKPHPEPYTRAAILMGIPAIDCVAIEDAPSGIASATTAGMTAIGITSSVQASALNEAHAIITSLHDVEVSSTANASNTPLDEHALAISLTP